MKSSTTSRHMRHCVVFTIHRSVGARNARKLVLCHQVPNVCGHVVCVRTKHLPKQQCPISRSTFLRRTAWRGGTDLTRRNGWNIGCH